MYFTSIVLEKLTKNTTSFTQGSQCRGYKPYKTVEFTFPIARYFPKFISYLTYLCNLDPGITTGKGLGNFLSRTLSLNYTQLLDICDTENRLNVHKFLILSNRILSECFRPQTFYRNRTMNEQ